MTTHSWCLTRFSVPTVTEILRFLVLRRGAQFDPGIALVVRFDQVLDLVAILFGHLVDAFIFVGLVAVLDLDLADLGLAVCHCAGHGNDERTFLMPRGEAVAGAKIAGDDRPRIHPRLHAQAAAKTKARPRSFAAE